MEISVRVIKCDKCGKEGAETWAFIDPAEGITEVDLCEKDVKPLLEIFALGRQSRQRRRPKTDRKQIVVVDPLT